MPLKLAGWAGNTEHNIEIPAPSQGLALEYPGVGVEYYIGMHTRCHTLCRTNPEPLQRAKSITQRVSLLALFSCFTKGGLYTVGSRATVGAWFGISAVFVF